LLHEQGWVFKQCFEFWWWVKLTMSTLQGHLSCCVRRSRQCCSVGASPATGSSSSLSCLGDRREFDDSSMRRMRLTGGFLWPPTRQGGGSCCNIPDVNR
jgi:hypothetical protein